MGLQQLYRDVCSNNGFTIESLAGDGVVTCGQFATLVARCRMRLAAAGVGAGDAVVFHGDQGLPALLVFWACVLDGTIFVPVDSGWPTYLLGKACGKVQPVLAIVEDGVLPAWQDVPGAPVIIPVSMLDLSILPADAALYEVGLGHGPDTTDPAEIEIYGTTHAAYLFTSGSTGEPKAVMLSHAALARSARLLVQTFDWRTGERLLNLPDPHTMSGLRNAFIAAPLAGMAWVCAPKALRGNVFTLLDCVQRAQAQRMVAAPVLLRHVNLLGPRVDAAVFASMKAIYCTGTDLNADEARCFHDCYGMPVVNYYGLTETVGLCLSQDVRTWSADDASIGRPVGCEARVVDEDGSVVAEGAVGELQLRLPHPMAGYLDDAEATASMFDAGWLRSGDLVQRDGEGRFSIVGRRGSFIKTMATEKIQPQEIEAVLEQCPGVAEAAVFGLHDPAGGERIVALIVVVADVDENMLADDTLAAFVRARLGQARVPGIFRRVQSIPRSSNGKILRMQLRTMD